MPRIRVQNAQRKLRVNGEALQEFAERALHLCLSETSPRESELRKLEEIAVVLVSDRRISALHRQFMNIAGPTDVITFQHGEIFVSTETAQRQARQFNTSTNDELQLYIAHGLLHLHGFDDTNDAARDQMHRVQSRVVAAVRRMSDEPRGSSAQV